MYHDSSTSNKVFDRQLLKGFSQFEVSLQCNTVSLTAPPMSWLKGRLVAEEVGAAWGAARWKISRKQNQIDGSVVCVGGSGIFPTRLLDI